MAEQMLWSISSRRIPADSKSLHAAFHGTQMLPEADSTPKPSTGEWNEQSIRESLGHGDINYQEATHLPKDAGRHRGFDKIKITFTQSFNRSHTTEQRPTHSSFNRLVGN